MTGENTARTDWRALWVSGDLARFTFVSLGILYQLSWIFRAFDMLE